MEQNVKLETNEMNMTSVGKRLFIFNKWYWDTKVIFGLKKRMPMFLRGASGYILRE